METDSAWKDVDMPFDGKRRMLGGSTISQQTARNVFLWPGCDWVRKGLEAGYTVLVETGRGKRRIQASARVVRKEGLAACVL